MNACAIVVSAGLMAVLAASPAVGQQKGNAQRQEVAVDQLPEAVTAAVKSTYPKGSIVSAFKMTGGKEARYELSVKETPDSTPFSVMANAKGQLRTATAAANAKGAARKGQTPAPNASNQGVSISTNDLPKAVAKAVQDAFPKDTILEVFKTTIGKDAQYELVLNDVASFKPMHVFVTADGTIQKR